MNACSKVKLSYSDNGPWPIGCDLNQPDIVGEEDLHQAYKLAHVEFL